MATRIADPGRVRQGQLTPLKIDGQWVCLDCQQPVKQPLRWNGKKCKARLRCEACSDLHHLYMHVLNGKSLCAYIVGKARERGQLAPVSGICTDCGKRPAECYDHRDYGEPLRVEPVCNSCNVIRGPAKPINQAIVSALLLAQFGEQAA